MKHTKILLFIASFCLLFWFGETLYCEWNSLIWINYNHHAIYLVPLVFILWVILLNGKNQLFKHLVIIPILLLLYLIFIFIINFIVAYFASEIFVRLAFGDWLPNKSRSINPYFILLSFCSMTFLLNVFLAILEKKKLKKKTLIFLFISPSLIPICSVLVTFILYLQSYLYPYFAPNPIVEAIDPFEWFKSGSLAFSFFIYEGFYYLWLKSIIHFNSFTLKYSPKRIIIGIIPNIFNRILKNKKKISY